MDLSSEKKIIAHLASRNEQAYEALLDHYEAGLYRFFYYSHGNHQTAQDQCGETFFRFVQVIRNNGNGHIQNLKAYLFGIARNIQAETYRKKGPVQETISLEERPCGKPSVFRQVSSHDELAFVWRIIGQFDETEKQILLLRFMENVSYEEIAEIMDMPLNSVKSHIHRGRQKLCELLSKKSPSE